MRQIAAPWGPDLWAEQSEEYIKAEAWCYKWCEYAKTCAVVGKPYSGPDCMLQMDEENSR